MTNSATHALIIALTLLIIFLAHDDYKAKQALKRLRPVSEVVTATAVIGRNAVTCYADGGFKVE